jgi:hypothetical protein
MYWFEKIKGAAEESKSTSPLLLRVTVKENGVSFQANSSCDSFVGTEPEVSGRGNILSGTWYAMPAASSILTCRRDAVPKTVNKIS